MSTVTTRYCDHCITHADVVQVVRGYLDTPFHHMGRLPDVGSVI